MENRALTCSTPWLLYLTMSSLAGLSILLPPALLVLFNYLIAWLSGASFQGLFHLVTSAADTLFYLVVIALLLGLVFGLARRGNESRVYRFLRSRIRPLRRFSLDYLVALALSPIFWLFVIMSGRGGLLKVIISRPWSAVVFYLTIGTFFYTVWQRAMVWMLRRWGTIPQRLKQQMVAEQLPHYPGLAERLGPVQAIYTPAPGELVVELKHAPRGSVLELADYLKRNGLVQWAGYSEVRVLSSRGSASHTPSSEVNP
ncbi:MAG TPA: hypothetical protein GXX29_07510 [Firmicutes bacterium]|nr:hypothetical protein [Bacillota bacterium]